MQITLCHGLTLDVPTAVLRLDQLEIADHQLSYQIIIAFFLPGYPYMSLPLTAKHPQIPYGKKL